VDVEAGRRCEEAEEVSAEAVVVAMAEGTVLLEGVDTGAASEAAGAEDTRRISGRSSQREVRRQCWAICIRIDQSAKQMESTSGCMENSVTQDNQLPIYSRVAEGLRHVLALFTPT